MVRFERLHVNDDRHPRHSLPKMTWHYVHKAYLYRGMVVYQFHQFYTKNGKPILQWTHWDPQGGEAPSLNSLSGRAESARKWVANKIDRQLDGPGAVSGATANHPDGYPLEELGKP